MTASVSSEAFFEAFLIPVANLSVTCWRAGKEVQTIATLRAFLSYHCLPLVAIVYTTLYTKIIGSVNICALPK